MLHAADYLTKLWLRAANMVHKLFAKLQDTNEATQVSTLFVFVSFCFCF